MGVRIDGTNSNVKGKTAMLGLAAAAVNFATDANYTAIEAEYECPIMVLSSSGALTATRNLVLPLRNGIFLIVYNGTTGGQSIQMIGASGTGYTLANAKHALLRCNGTNWVKVFVEA